MTIKVKKQVEERVELSTPAYFKIDQKYFAILSEEKVVSVFLFDNTTLVDEGTPLLTDFSNISQGEEITEDDFQFALGMALERLSKFQTATV